MCMCACVWLPLLIYFPCRSPQRSRPPSAQWFPTFSFLWNLPWRPCLPSVTRRRQIVCTAKTHRGTLMRTNWFIKTHISNIFSTYFYFSPRGSQTLSCADQDKELLEVRNSNGYNILCVRVHSVLYECDVCRMRECVCSLLVHTYAVHLFLLLLTGRIHPQTAGFCCVISRSRFLF